ncbi:putative phage tail protein [Tepidibacter mesophilus]|uniref:putative phage tail protein n=1 Tax=Tepidibacter mesophilus TaxID=655607 RepID=UPI001FA8DE3E|nr:putative phage tail protein [Tepidibacter mesophilus]
MYKDRMISYLPSYERKSKVINDVLTPIDLEFKNKDIDIDDLEKQLSIDTATWGLVIYEEESNIKTDITKSYEERRSVIKSKTRGNGKVDAKLIKMVVDAWTNGNVEVGFNGKLDIKFNSIYGIPSNLEDLRKALDDIKPAHLSIIYKFAYLLIKDIHNVMTLNDIQNTKLNKFAGGEV